MAVVMRLVDNPSGEHEVVCGSYVRDFDPMAHDGRGYVVWTQDIARAHRFPDMAEAIETWRAVPACRPTREDGRPNRPLTAFTMEFVDVG